MRQTLNERASRPPPERAAGMRSAGQLNAAANMPGS
jgi:hypothetical protein